MAVVKFRCFISGMLWTACVFECHVVVEHHDFASRQRSRSSAEQPVSLTLKTLLNFLGGHFRNTFRWKGFCPGPWTPMSFYSTIS